MLKADLIDHITVESFGSDLPERLDLAAFVAEWNRRIEQLPDGEIDRDTTDEIWQEMCDTWRDFALSPELQAGQEITQQQYEEARQKESLPLPPETAEKALHEYGIPVHEGFLSGVVYENGYELYHAYGRTVFNNPSFYYLGLSPRYPDIENGEYYLFDDSSIGKWGLCQVTDLPSRTAAMQYAADHECGLSWVRILKGTIETEESLYTPAFL